MDIDTPHRMADKGVSPPRSVGTDSGRPAPRSAAQPLAPARRLSRVTCPHCWHRFELAKILWISRHAELRGDQVLGAQEAVRFLPTRFTVEGQAIDAREMVCQELACPRCHLSIPIDLLEIEPLFLSIVGTPSSGKSYFLASMTWRLRQDMPSQFGISFSDADPLSNRSLKGYEETFFLQGDPDGLVGLEKTQLEGGMYDDIKLGQQYISLPRPFLFTVRPTARHPNHAMASAINRVLCLYDNAGEHFRPGMDATAAPTTQHLAKARVLMLLYDPMQDPRFRDRCRTFSQDPQLTDKGRLDRQETILSEVSLRIRRYCSLSSTQKLERPLLVLVAKSDAWGPLLKDIDIITEPYVVRPGKLAALDVARVEMVSAKLKELMMSIAPDFVAAADDFCSHVVYIPVSALGGAPVSDPATGMLLVRPREIQPRWVTVPVLYSFAKWSTGLVSGLKPRR
jgi:hypothetical protein